MSVCVHVCVCVCLCVYVCVRERERERETDREREEHFRGIGSSGETRSVAACNPCQYDSPRLNTVNEESRRSHDFAIKLQLEPIGKQDNHAWNEYEHPFPSPPLPPTRHSPLLFIIITLYLY